MFKNRFLVVLGVLSLLLVAMVVVKPFSHASPPSLAGANDFYQRHSDWTWASRAQVAAVPVTGANPSGNESNTSANASQKIHRNCVSEAIQRQSACQEPSLSSASTLGNGKAEPQASPSQQLHSDCASEDSQRQDSCIP